MATGNPDAAAESLADSLQAEYTAALSALKADLKLTPAEETMISNATTTVGVNTLALVGATANEATVLQEEIRAASATLGNIAVTHEIAAAQTFNLTAQTVINAAVQVGLRLALAALI